MYLVSRIDKCFLPMNLSRPKAVCVVQDGINTKGMCFTVLQTFVITQPRAVGLGNGQDLNQYNNAVPRAWVVVSRVVQLPGKSGDAIYQNIVQTSRNNIPLNCSP